MKHMIFCIVAGLMAVLTAAAMLTVDTVHTRQKELDDALSLSCREVMEDTYDSLAYREVTDQEFLDKFMKLMEDKICQGDREHDPNLSLQIDVAALDLQNGLFSVKATEYFTYPNGTKGKVTGEKTALYEECEYVA